MSNCDNSFLDNINMIWKRRTIMKHNQLMIFGKIVKKYKLPLKDIKDLNQRYEKAKDHLTSYGARLAGRLHTELDLMGIIEGTTIFKKITECMDDYINTSIKHDLLVPGPHNLNIIGCWMNDMVEGEYNPPHTHHNGTGYSVVLFTKVPEFINDAKDPHKFKDGMLGLVGIDGIGTQWLTPEVGDFYIFRADHQHCVMPFKTKKPGAVRRSMSFNFEVTPPQKNTS
jgi:hypothetical protein